MSGQRVLDHIDLNYSIGLNLVSWDNNVGCFGKLLPHEVRAFQVLHQTHKEHPIVHGAYYDSGVFRSYVESFSRIAPGVRVVNSVRVGSLERAHQVWLASIISHEIYFLELDHARKELVVILPAWSSQLMRPLDPGLPCFDPRSASARCGRIQLQREARQSPECHLQAAFVRLVVRFRKVTVQ